jgi:hypothetical protein
MSRVLATTELELRDQLMRAKDLDKLIEVHQNYINRIYDRPVLFPSPFLPFVFDDAFLFRSSTFFNNAWYP